MTDLPVIESKLSTEDGVEVCMCHSLVSSRKVHHPHAVIPPGGGLSQSGSEGLVRSAC